MLRVSNVPQSLCPGLSFSPCRRLEARFQSFLTCRGGGMQCIVMLASHRLPPLLPVSSDRSSQEKVHHLGAARRPSSWATASSAASKCRDTSRRAHQCIQLLGAPPRLPGCCPRRNLDGIHAVPPQAGPLDTAIHLPCRGSGHLVAQRPAAVAQCICLAAAVTSPRYMAVAVPVRLQDRCTDLARCRPEGKAGATLRRGTSTPPVALTAAVQAAVCPHMGGAGKVPLPPC